MEVYCCGLWVVVVLQERERPEGEPSGAAAAAGVAVSSASMTVIQCAIDAKLPLRDSSDRGGTKVGFECQLV
jgi:hypothetical protein